jgi:hypothetical protein
MKTTPASVWVVEKGSYSDYRVVGVFSSKENAERIRDYINTPPEDGYIYDDATVAEWPLDPGVDALNQGLSRWSVGMLKNGEVERVAPYKYRDELRDEMREWEREEALAYRGKGVPNVLSATVWASDEKHAIKIVNEHRIQMLALGQWKGKLG